MKLETKTKTILYSIEFINGIRRALVSALALIYFISLGFSVVSITTLFAISVLILTLFEFPTGAFADFYSRKKSIVLSFFLFFVAYLGIFSAKSFWTIALFWVLQDIAWTFQSGTTSAWAIDILKYQSKKSKLLSLISENYFFEKFGWVIGGVVGLVIVSIKFRFIWLFISIMYLVVTLLLMKYMDEEKVKKIKIGFDLIFKTFDKAKESIIYFVHENQKIIRGLALSSSLGGMAIGAFNIIFPLILKQTFTLSSSRISGIFTIVGIILLAAPFIGSYLGKKFGIRNPLSLGLFVIGLALIVFSITHSLIAVIALGILIHLIDLATSIVHDTALHHNLSSSTRASLGSAFSIFWSISYSLTTWLTGLIITYYGLVYAGFFAALFAFIASISYWISLKEAR